MLIKGSWRDAMLLYRPDGTGGSGDGGENDGQDDAGGAMSPEEMAAELERTRDALKKANAEATQRRLRLEALEKAENDRKAAELSDVEKAKKEAEDARAEAARVKATHRESLIKTEVKMAAMAAGFVDANDAVVLVDQSGIAINDDDGTVTGAKEAVAKLAKAKPHLIKAPQPDIPDINSGAGGSGRPLTGDELLKQRRPTDTMYSPM